MNNLHKFEVFPYVLDNYFKGRKDVIVLEYGRLRSLRPSDKITDGWSTLQISEHPAVKTLYSLDTNNATIAKCKQLIPEEAGKKILYAKRISEFKELSKNSVDFLFLDAGNSPQQCLELYEEAAPYLKDTALILLDDVLDLKGHKGEIVVPLWRGMGYIIKNIHPMVLAIPYATLKAKGVGAKITACIFTYMRPAVLQGQIEAIENQTIPPSEIIIGHLNNVESAKFDFGDHKLIEFHYDPGIHAKFILATAAMPNTDFVAIFDDDVIPGKRWFENCLESYKKKKGVYGILGFDIYGDFPRHSGGEEFPTKEIRQVDFLGQGFFFPFEYLKHVWNEPFPFYNQSGDDMWFGYQLSKEGIECYTPPVPSDDREMWGRKDMKEGHNKGLYQRDSQHNANRERLVRHIRAQGWKPINER